MNSKGFSVGSHSPSSKQTVLFAAGTAVIALLLFAYYVLTWGNYSGFAYALDTCGVLFCDFASYYYPMGAAIFRTALPVSGFVYSPFIAILLSIFPPLGYSASLALWGFLQVLSIFLYILVFRLLVPAGLQVQLLFVTLVLSSFPVLHNLVWGQVGIFTTVAVLGLLFIYKRGHHAAAAVPLAFATGFKFFPLIFLAPFAARRNKRFLLFAAAACGVFLFLLPGVLLGFGDTLRFFSALLDSYREMGWVVANYNSQHFPHVILRLADAFGRDVSASLPLLRCISYVIAAANVALTVLVQRVGLPYADLWSFQLIFLTIPFVLYTSWPVDLVFLSFTQAFLAWWLIEGEGPPSWNNTAVTPLGKGERPKRTLRARKALALFLLLLSIILSNMIFFNLISDRLRYGFLGFLFWADLFLLIASYVVLLPDALSRMWIPPKPETPAEPPG